MGFLCSFSVCALFYSERAWDQQGSYYLVAQCSRLPESVSRRSHELPSHVLVIASLLFCGARGICDHMLLAFLVPAPLLGKTSHERLLRKCDV